jgi:hypothetical protein
MNIGQEIEEIHMLPSCWRASASAKYLAAVSISKNPL